MIIASKRDVYEMTITPSTWDSSVTGMVIELPPGLRLDQVAVERLLSEQFHVDGWDEVRDPDPMQLR